MSWRVCNVVRVDCPDLTDHPSGRCETHRLEAQRASDAKRPSARERGYDSRWERTRDAYLAAFPRCEQDGCDEPATDVDHIDGEGPNGPRGHDWTNLRSLCGTHHKQRTARDQPGGWNRRARRGNATTPFVIVAGASGVGKTEVRHLLAERLDAVSLGPDDFAEGWAPLYDELDGAARAVVECVRLPRALRRKRRERRAVIVHLTAAPDVRRARLHGRGDPAHVVDARLDEAVGSLGYEETIVPDLTIATDTVTPAEVADHIASSLRGTSWG